MSAVRRRTRFHYLIFKEVSELAGIVKFMIGSAVSCLVFVIMCSILSFQHLDLTPSYKLFNRDLDWQTLPFGTVTLSFPSRIQDQKMYVGIWKWLWCCVDFEFINLFLSVAWAFLFHRFNDVGPQNRRSQASQWLFLKFRSVRLLDKNLFGA